MAPAVGRTVWTRPSVLFMFWIIQCGRDEMKLYWAPKTRSMRALWMLEEAGCPYERVLIDIASGAQASAEYRAINPMMKVPALTDGAAMVAESAAICAFVAERCPEAGLAPPIGDPARGRYLHWLFFASGCIEPAYTQKFMQFTLNPVAAGWFRRCTTTCASAA